MDASARLRVRTDQHDEGILIVLAGEVDPHTSPQLDDVLAEAVAGGPARIVVDAEHVDFVDSSGLRVLLRAQRAQRDRHGTLELRSPSPIVRRLLQLTALEATFRC